MELCAEYFVFCALNARAVQSTKYQFKTLKSGFQVRMQQSMKKMFAGFSPH